MKNFLLLFLMSSLLLISCSQIRESAGVNRKDIDEFTVVENPPLIIPPDFNLLPPEQLSERDINNAEGELAKEILFGLTDDKAPENNESSTMESIINKTDYSEVEINIREEIDQQFASEKQNNSKNWNNEKEILDAVAESERLRNKNLNKESEDNKKIPTLKTKTKKKKRFFFF